MISNPAMVRAINERADALFNVYQRERRAGADPLTANEAVLDFAKRLDAAEQRVADDQFEREIAILRSCMERTR